MDWDLESGGITQEVFDKGAPINDDHHMESMNLSGLSWKALNERTSGVLGVNVHPSTGVDQCVFSD